MEQITTHKEDRRTFRARIETIRQRVASGIKWWAEHQSWPATDEIRIERHRSTCG